MNDVVSKGNVDREFLETGSNKIYSRKILEVLVGNNALNNIRINGAKRL